MLVIESEERRCCVLALLSLTPQWSQKGDGEVAARTSVEYLTKVCHPSIFLRVRRRLARQGLGIVEAIRGEDQEGLAIGREAVIYGLRSRGYV